MNLPVLLWNVATEPTIEDLQGEFDVNIHTGALSEVKRFIRIWRKKIKEKAGYNIQDGKNTGYFEVINTGDCSITFNYDIKSKEREWRLLRDSVKKVNNDFFIGKVYTKILGTYYFCGYFSLTRVWNTNN